MERPTFVLAETPGFGRIFDCGECGHIHVAIGPVTLTIDAHAYMQLVALVNTSAANFETWLQQLGAPAPHDDSADRGGK